MLNQSFVDAGNSDFKTTVLYCHFLSAWYAYMELLDINFSEGFQCSECGPNPPLIIMDATALSFRRKLDFWGNIPIKEDGTKETIIPRKSRYSRLHILNG